MDVVYLSTSNRDGKKYKVVVNGKTIHFGAEGYDDYTKHNDAERKAKYIARHKTRENWTKSGINTAGFWSRWLLWNEPTLQGSVKAIEKRFNIKIFKA